MHVVFSAFTSRRVSLLATNKASVLFFMVCIPLLNKGHRKSWAGFETANNLKNGPIYTFRILKCSEKFNVLDLP